MINKHNYEIWIMDYMDGRLSPPDLDRVRAFVADHPELQIDLDDTNFPTLSTALDQKLDKKHLYQPISFERDEIFIAYMEGDLTNDEIQRYRDKLEKEPQFKARHLLFYQIKMDDEVQALDKSNIYSTKYSETDVDDLIQAKLDGSIKAGEEKWLNEHFSASFIENKENQWAKLTVTPDLTVKFPYRKGLKRRPAWVFYMQRAAAVVLLLLSVYGIQKQWNSTSIDNGSSPIVQNQLPDNAWPIVINPIAKKQDSEADRNKNKANDIVYIDNKTNDAKVVDRVDEHIRNNDQPNEYSVNNTIPEVGDNTSSDDFFNHMNRVVPPAAITRLDPQRTISSLMSNEDLIDYRDMPALRHSQIAPPEHRGYGGGIEIDIPPVMMAMANMVGHASQAYGNGLKNNRTIFDFRLGPVSFYKSSTNQ